jgi:hypothetical protein
MILLVDIDGTIADNSHREGFLQGGKKDWDSFYNPELMAKDLPIEAAMDVLPRLITLLQGNFFFLTGRPERTRAVTVAWLEKHIGCTPKTRPDAGPDESHRPFLCMRPDGDHRRASVYKEDLAAFLTGGSIRTQNGNVVLAKPRQPLTFIDDDERNTDMYRKYGIFLKAPECWSVFR